MITPQAIATYPFLGELSPRGGRLAAAGAELRSVPRGVRLLRKGDRIRSLVLVLSGRLRVFTITPAGDEVTLYQLGPGDSCPLVLHALLEEKFHQAWVETDRAAKLLCLPASLVRTLYEDERAVREFALQVLSGRIVALMTALEEVSLNSIEQRLRSHLLRAADERGEIETTHAQIAVALGTAREVVSRQLERLRAAGLIRTGRGRIVVLRPRALA